MDEGTALHGLDPEVRLGNETMTNTSMKLALDENCKNQSPKKADTLSDQGLSWNTTALVFSFS